MLTRAPAHVGTRLQADASRLPLADGSIAAVVCVDVLLFPREILRVLRGDGVLLWANQLGDDGPLFVDTPTVAAALVVTGMRCRPRLGGAIGPCSATAVCLRSSRFIRAGSQQAGTGAGRPRP
jgi:hypothetical protein